MSPEYALAMTALIAAGRARNALRSFAPEVIWSCCKSSTLSGSAVTTLSECVFGSNMTGKHEERLGHLLRDHRERGAVDVRLGELLRRDEPRLVRPGERLEHVRLGEDPEARGSPPRSARSSAPCTASAASYCSCLRTPARSRTSPAFLDSCGFEGRMLTAGLPVAEADDTSILSRRSAGVRLPSYAETCACRLSLGGDAFGALVPWRGRLRRPCPWRGRLRRPCPWRGRLRRRCPLAGTPSAPLSLGGDAFGAPKRATGRGSR